MQSLFLNIILYYVVTDLSLDWKGIKLGGLAFKSWILCFEVWGCDIPGVVVLLTDGLINGMKYGCAKTEAEGALDKFGMEIGILDAWRNPKTTQ